MKADILDTATSPGGEVPDTPGVRYTVCGITPERGITLLLQFVRRALIRRTAIRAAGVLRPRGHLGGWRPRYGAHTFVYHRRSAHEPGSRRGVHAPATCPSTSSPSMPTVS